jgi:hypothetical protein
MGRGGVVGRELRGGRVEEGEVDSPPKHQQQGDPLSLLRRRGVKEARRVRSAVSE